MKRIYTWKPDLPDQRDHVFAVPEAVGIPTHVDLRPQMTPVFDQGNLGSCTGNAIAGALEYLEKRDSTFFNVSRLFIYYQERVIEHTVKSDAGAMIRDGVKACHLTGYCGEKLWPYKISKFAVKPPVAAYTVAAQHKVAEYARVLTLTNAKNALAGGFPVVFGFSVYDSFESDAVAKSGIVPMPAKDEKMLGGHAVLMVGYDDASQRVIVRNSWGSAWGQKGYFTMPYAYITDRNLSDDFWVIRK